MATVDTIMATGIVMGMDTIMVIVLIWKVIR
jgi:hypothetical protein